VVGVGVVWYFFRSNILSGFNYRVNSANALPALRAFNLPQPSDRHSQRGDEQPESPFGAAARGRFA
jgi:hypothetical protein